LGRREIDVRTKEREPCGRDRRRNKRRGGPGKRTKQAEGRRLAGN